jgi:hypothetical protein
VTDTEILDWIQSHPSKLGLKPEWAWAGIYKKGEFTDIRKRVIELAELEKETSSQLTNNSTLI